MLDYLDFIIADSRDQNRTPMQWNDQPGTDFSTNRNTWLPIHPNSRMINVEKQKGKPFTHLEQFRLLTKLKDEETMTRGSFNYKILPNNVLVFTRFTFLFLFITVLNN